MESHQAVRIWGRKIRAISPSVNVQSLPRFLAALTHVNAEYRNQGIAIQPLVLDCVGSPCKPASASMNQGLAQLTQCVIEKLISS
jgi:hypothetical protein